MRDALRAEWTKLRTTAGPRGLLLIAVLLTVVGGALISAATSPAPGRAADLTKLTLSGVQAGQAALAVLAVLTMGEEYASGMILLTLTAIPRRLSVLSSKAILVGALVLAAATIAVLASLLLGRLLLEGNGFALAHGHAVVSLADGRTLRAAAGSVLYLCLIALLSLGVASLVRDSAAAIGIVLGLLYVFPIVATMVGEPELARRLKQIAPMTAGLAIQATVGIRHLPIGPWAGLGVLAAWAAGALLLGAFALRMRDA